MTHKPLRFGAISIAAVAVLAGCGSSSSPTPTASSGGLTLPSLPGLGSGTGGNNPAAAASAVVSAADMQNISGDPNVAAVAGTCSAVTCIYADPAGSSGNGGIVVVEPFPGALGQAALETAVAAALAGGGSDSTGTVSPVSGLGNSALKEIDSNSATYAFFKDNYLVLINVQSDTKTGADMDSQVLAAAQSAAGQI